MIITCFYFFFSFSALKKPFSGGFLGASGEMFNVYSLIYPLPPPLPNVQCNPRGAVNVYNTGRSRTPTAYFIKKVLSVYSNSMTTIYLSLSAQVAKSTFFMKSPVSVYNTVYVLLTMQEALVVIFVFFNHSCNKHILSMR